MVKIESTIEDSELKVNCKVCGRYCSPKWTINYPFDLYCSEYCRERDNIIKVNGYPLVSDADITFWSKVVNYKKQAQRLNVKKTGSKIAHKVAQKSGSTPPYIRVEPLSHEPIFKNELEPVFTQHTLDGGNDDS